MSVGHKWLRLTLNYVPSYSWQLDPFGHSKSYAYLYEIMGFEAHFMGRIDEYEKSVRFHNDEVGPAMEFIWKSSEDLDSSIFSSVMLNPYLATKGFDYDNRENHKWVNVTSSNLESKSVDFYYEMRNTSIHWLGKNYM